jgi:hypothetical protein
MGATARTYQVGVTRQNPVPGTITLRPAPKRRFQVLSAPADRSDLRYPVTIKALFGNVKCKWNCGRWSATVRRLVDTRRGAARPVTEVA